MKWFSKKEIDEGTAPRSKLKVETVFHDDHKTLTYSQIIRAWLIRKFLSPEDFAEYMVEAQRTNEERSRRQDPHYNPSPEGIEVVHLALILDGEVKDILRSSKILADYLTAEPKFVAFSPSETHVDKGMRYINEEFINEHGQRASEDSPSESSS